MSFSREMYASLLQFYIFLPGTVTYFFFLYFTASYSPCSTCACIVLVFLILELFCSQVLIKQKIKAIKQKELKIGCFYFPILVLCSWAERCRSHARFRFIQPAAFVKYFALNTLNMKPPTTSKLKSKF